MVRGGEAGDDGFASGSKAKFNYASVVGRAGASNQAAVFQTVDQFDGAVVAQEQFGGEFTHFERAFAGGGFQRQQHLVVLGGQADALSGLGTEIEEPPQGTAEGREGAVVGGRGTGGASGHREIGEGWHP